MQAAYVTRSFLFLQPVVPSSPCVFFLHDLLYLSDCSQKWFSSLTRQAAELAEGRWAFEGAASWFGSWVGRRSIRRS